MKKISKKSIIALVAALTTMLSIAVVTYAVWTYNSVAYSVGNASGRVEVGFQEHVGYAEVDATDNVYAEVNGWVGRLYDRDDEKSIILGSFDEDTYRQFSATYPGGSINAIECDFEVVGDTTYERTVGIEMNVKYDCEK